MKGIKHFQVSANKAVIIITGEEVDDLIIKEIAQDYDWSYLQPNIREGEKISLSDTAASNQQNHPS